MLYQTTPAPILRDLWNKLDVVTQFRQHANARQTLTPMIIHTLAVNAEMLQDKELYSAVVAKFVADNNDMPQI